VADSAKIVPSAFTQLAGVIDEKPRVTNINNKELNNTPVSKYSHNEILSVIRNTYVSDKEVPNPNLANAEGLISYFLPIHEQIGQVLLDTEKMKKLAPEINQAKLIRISSIMSPNDMQDGKFIFDIDQIPGLTEDARKKITDLLSEFFNETEKLAKKAAKWSGDALYGPGASPVLLLPSSYQKAMHEDGKHIIGNRTDDKVIGNTSLSVESIKFTKQEYMKKLENTFIYTDNTVGIEHWALTIQKDTDHKSKWVDDIYDNLPTTYLLDKEKDELRVGIEQITVNFIKQIEAGDIIKLTENPEIIKFATEYRKNTSKQLENKLQNHFNMQMSYKQEDLISLNKYINTKEVDDTHPLMLDIPAESVIPICVPSNEREHLGYFILLDESGQPIKADESRISNSNGWGGGPQAAFQAMFGSSERNIFQSPNFKNYEEMTVRKIFNGLLDEYLKSKLRGIGHEDVTIDKTNAIMTTMLYRLLEHKRTRILFIPSFLMSYICFDYRKNGTGKSLLEDIHYLLSLRVTFQVAALMGMAKDAINHRTLNLTFANQETNPRALMDQLVNMFVEKERMPFSLDPTEVSRGIARNAISVAPKNLPGLDEFGIERVNDAGGGGNKPDTELLDTITNMLVTALGVPYSALNQLAEQEYAKSIVTTNLFYSKQIRQDQDILCLFAEHLVKQYIKFSPKLQTKIQAIIKEFLKDPDDTSEEAEKKNEKRGTVPSTQHAPELENDVITKLNMITKLVIDSIRLKLPTPNIAQDKAQYAEITEYINALDQFLNVKYANELVPADNMEATTALNVIKATIKSIAIDDFFSKVGVVNTMDLPSIEEFIAKHDATDVLQILMNFNKGLKDVATKFGSADPMGMGGSDMSMMGDDMMGGMGDEGMMGDEPPMDMNMDTGPEMMPDEVPTSTKEENKNMDGTFNIPEDNKPV